MEEKIKFSYIFICFCISIIGLKKPLSKRESRLLVAAMLFTLVSDFMLIILYNNILGVFTFCCVHVIYICRNKAYLPLRNDETITRKVFSKKICNLIILPFLICAASIFLITRIFFDTLISLSASYAYLFMINLYLSYKMFKSSVPAKINRQLIFAGTLLFALCDINVLLFNLRFYVKNSIIVETVSPAALILIWVFYTPSQAMLALSGINYGKKEDVF